MQKSVRGEYLENYYIKYCVVWHPETPTNKSVKMSIVFGEGRNFIKEYSYICDRSYF